MNPLILGTLGLGALGFIAYKATSDVPESNIDESSDESGSAPSGFTYAEWTRFDNDFKSAGTAFGIDWTWLKAIALNESSLGKNWRVANGDVSFDGLSKGLMQFTLSTAQKLDSSATLPKLAELNPATYSINLAGLLLKQLGDTYSWAPEWTIKAYNVSPKAIQNQIAGVPNGINRNGDDIDQLMREYYARWQRNYNLVRSYPT